MKDWINSNKKIPEKTEICDFVFFKDDACDQIWMLCHAFVHETFCLQNGDDYYWRKAEPLPRSIVASKFSQSKRKKW